MDVAQTRLAVQHAARDRRVYRGLFHCLSSVARSEGVRGLYRGAVPSMLCTLLWYQRGHVGVCARGYAHTQLGGLVGARRCRVLTPVRVAMPGCAPAFLPFTAASFACQEVVGYTQHQVSRESLTPTLHLCLAFTTGAATLAVSQVRRAPRAQHRRPALTCGPSHECPRLWRHSLLRTRSTPSVA